MGVYILGVTMFARKESNPTDRVLLLTGGGLTLLAAVLVIFGSLFFPEILVERSGVLWILGLTAIVGYRMTQAFLTPTPERVQLAVKTAVLCVILFDAALVAYARGPLWAVVVVILLIPAVGLGKWLYTT
jgi:4-hydroxybenzoate polyprenyltransferase